MKTTNKSSDKRRSSGYQPDETRRLLVQSALKLFEEKGYPSTSVDEIVEAANLTKGAFYHHFGAKEEVLRLIHDDYVDAQLVECRRILSEVESPIEQVHALIRQSLRSVEEYRSHLTVYFQDRRFLTGKRRDAVIAKRIEIDTVFERAIDNGVAQGVLRADLSAKLVGFGVVGMCAWAYQWHRPGGKLTADEIADQFSSMILNGLAVHD